MHLVRFRPQLVQLYHCQEITVVHYRFSLCNCNYSLLRPIAGSINYCPQAFSENTDEDNIRIGMHEVIHALVRK